MKRIVLVVAAAAGLFALSALPATTSGSQHVQFKGGETSIDALIAKFLHAVDARDEHALHQLRVTEREYRDIIIPGTVKPGQPLREGVTEQNSKFFWGMLNQKSEDFGRAFIKGLGGRHVKRKELTFSNGTREFAGYTAHGDVHLVIEDESGQTTELNTGTIAEVSGRYKFISFSAK